MRRFHEEVSLMEGRAHARARDRAWSWRGAAEPHPAPDPVGCFRKRPAFGCGRAHCLLCHYNKLLDIPDVRDRAAKLTARESLAEYLAPQEEG